MRREAGCLNELLLKAFVGRRRSSGVPSTEKRLEGSVAASSIVQRTLLAPQVLALLKDGKAVRNVPWEPGRTTATFLYGVFAVKLLSYFASAVSA
jgi:hypothetical protein